jgi:putative ABC transport system permease protein
MSVPELASAILRRLLPERDREAVLGDLIEEYHRHVLPERGRARARLWFWHQVLRSVPGALALRFAASHERAAAPRRGRGGAMDLWQDVRYGIRLLRKSPPFAFVAVGTIVLGVGANTAIFAVVHAVLLHPLPFAEPARLVALWEKNPERHWMFNLAAPANALDWRERAMGLEDVTAHGWVATISMKAAAEPEMVSGAQVFGNFFSVLGVPPLLGRTFTMEETWASESAVVVLSHGCWQRRFGSDPSVVGRRITLDGEARTVVGVMPEGFEFPSRGIDLWVPFGWNPANRTEVWFRRAHFLWPIGRLGPGVSLEQARAELEVVASRLEREYPETNRSMGAGLTPLHEWMVGETRRPLLVLFAAVGLVLLIACANVANLLLARSTGRSRELAVRGALGAGRLRLVRQLLAESLLLAGLGGALALVLAKMVLPLLVQLVPAEIPRLHEVRFGVEVSAFALGVSLLTAIAFGLAPAFHASGSTPGATLRESGRGLTRARGGARKLLVVSEVTLAVILAAGAGLLIRSLLNLSDASPGFQADRVWSASLSLPESRYAEDDDRLRFHRESLERLQGLPGVSSVAAADYLPLTGLHWTTDFLFEGRSPEELGVEFHRRRVSPGYFRILGVPFLAGRDFAESDAAETAPVVIVNQSLARLYFENEEAVGKRLAFENEEPRRWLEIVGVVGDEKLEGVHLPSRPEVFLPVAQSPPQIIRYLFRFEVEPEAALRSVRAELTELDADIPLFGAAPLEAVVAASTARQRFLTTLLGSFAGLAMILAAVGIYGVVSCGVSQRTYEIGIRLALGAREREVVRMIARQSFVPGLVGIGIGLLVTVMISGVLSSLLFEVSRRDIKTLVLVAAIMAIVTWVASYLPARRASGVDAITTLRSE